MDLQQRKSAKIMISLYFNWHPVTCVNFQIRGYFLCLDSMWLSSRKHFLDLQRWKEGVFYFLFFCGFKEILLITGVFLEFQGEDGDFPVVPYFFWWRSYVRPPCDEIFYWLMVTFPERTLLFLWDTKIGENIAGSHQWIKNVFSLFLQSWQVFS